MEVLIIPTRIKEEETYDVINKACKNHTLFAFGKNPRDLYYYLWEEFFKNAYTNEIVFWDKGRKQLLDTGLKIVPNNKDKKVTKETLKDLKNRYYK